MGNVLLLTLPQIKLSDNRLCFYMDKLHFSGSTAMHAKAKLSPILLLFINLHVYMLIQLDMYNCLEWQVAIHVYM